MWKHEFLEEGAAVGAAVVVVCETVVNFVVEAGVVVAVVVVGTGQDDTHLAVSTVLHTPTERPPLVKGVPVQSVDMN